MFFQNGSYSGVHGNVDLMGAEWRGRECRYTTGVLGLAADSESHTELLRQADMKAQRTPPGSIDRNS